MGEGRQAVCPIPLPGQLRRHVHLASLAHFGAGGFVTLEIAFFS